jgi:hypothetical protein
LFENLNDMMKNRSVSAMLRIAMATLFCGGLSAQGVTIGSPNPPDPAAVLDVQSVQGGVLFPRMSEAQRDAIVAAPDGLVLFNTDTECLQIHYSGQGWQNLACRCQSFPNAVFTGPAGSTAPIGVAVSFQAPVANGQTYSWVFSQGNPATSSQDNPSVTWSQVGTYAVSLTVTDLNGCSSTYTDSINVSACPGPGSQTFSYTGSVQTFTVPACKTLIQIEAWGAQGRSATLGGVGGLGGQALGTLAVTPGQTLQIYVGGQLGFNGGGAPGPNGVSTSGGQIGLDSGGVGGGASDVRTGNALTDRVIVAGGGGGGGHLGIWTSCLSPPGTGGAGGAGGGTAGGNGVSTACNCNNGGGFGGQPGTLSTGGAGGTLNPTGCGSSSTAMHGNPGTFGIGGNGSTQFGSSSGAGGGGGGGGGWYGGGAGSNGNNTTAGGGGGGGSNYIGGVTNGQTQNGVRSGNGQIIISWN